MKNFEDAANFDYAPVDFEDAIKRGKAKGIAQVTNSLFTSATDGNVTAQIFYLKNQDPKTWKDRVENVHATINLNDVLSGAKDRLVDQMATIKKPKVINAVKSTATASSRAAVPAVTRLGVGSTRYEMANPR